MNIHGLTKTTLLDYPGLVACTVFTGGCNMRCRFCQNFGLVVSSSDSVINEEEIYTFLEKRKNVLAGVCISGGEPTLQEDLPSFLMKIRQYGYKIKLDTNGLKPDMVERVLDASLADMFSVDIKSSRRGYEKICGVKYDKAGAVKDTLRLIAAKNVKAELRTTVCDGIHTAEDFREIGEWLLEFDMPYYLQAFRSSEFVPDKSILEPTPEKMQIYAEVLSKYFKKVSIRGQE